MARCAAYHQQILPNGIEVLLLQPAVHNGVQDQEVKDGFEFNLRVRLTRRRTSSFSMSRMAGRMFSPSTSSRSRCHRAPNSAPFVWIVTRFAICPFTLPSMPHSQMRLHTVHELLDRSHLLHKARQLADTALAVLRSGVVHRYNSLGSFGCTLHLVRLLLQELGNDGDVVIRNLAEQHVVAIHRDDGGNALRLSDNSAVDRNRSRVDGDELDSQPQAQEKPRGSGLRRSEG